MTGAVVQDAIVAVLSVATNQTRRITSVEDGSYRFAAIPVGDYELRVEMLGFAPYSNPVVTITLGRTVVLDVTLGLAGVTEALGVNQDQAEFRCLHYPQLLSKR
jgi:hypothetical protein